MTDLGACLGINALKEFNRILEHRKKIFNIYLNELYANSNIYCVNKDDGLRTHAAWLFTIISDKKDKIQSVLRKNRIETNQVHFRNDHYSIFKKHVKNAWFPNMDYAENRYLVLPIHHKITEKMAKYIATLINKKI